MTAIVFTTKGLLDLKALQTFGINSKPNSSNPIGYFGTGLKYAIAVLLRNNIDISIWIGQKKYVFYCKKEEFRDKEFDFVYMKQYKEGFREAINWTHTQLPFTTELGKNWELWHAFRELESNTRDENGTTSAWNDNNPKFSLEELVFPEDYVTKIIVRGEKFADVWAKKDEIFLPKSIAVRDEIPRKIQVINKPSDYVYYRGLRVMKLPKPSMYTYNILEHLMLTEDRTVMYDYHVRQSIVDYIMKSNDEPLIHSVAVLSKDDNYYETVLTFDEGTEIPGETFKEVIGKIKKRRGTSAINERVYSRYARYEEPDDPEELLHTRLKGWIDSGELSGYDGLIPLLNEIYTELEDRGL